MSASGDLTKILEAVNAGDEDAGDRLVPLVYAELRQMARALMASDPNQTLQPTALVHEAFLRLLVGGYL